MTDLLQRVEQSILDRRLLRPGQRALVAVSGGMDSMALLNLLQQLAAKHRWRLVVAHFNHRLRGTSSDADERLVRTAARRLQLPFAAGAWPVKSRATIKQFGLEMAARLARHEFFKTQARTFKASVVALAHHADDQVELFFLRLLRGAGGEGLAGMKWRNPSPADKRLMLIRPLLHLRKLELANYARDRRVPFREDASNRDVRHDRNWVRNILLPTLAQRFGSSSAGSILRTMDLTGAEADFARVAAESLPKGPGRDFVSLHAAVQRQFLRLELRRLGIPAGYDLVEQLRRCTNVPIAASPGIQVQRDNHGDVRLCPTPSVTFLGDALGVELTRNGRCEFGGNVMTWRIQKSTRPFQRPQSRAGQEQFDAARIGQKIVLRHWRPGDRFQPIGMKNPVKLQDLFTNAKISRIRRRNLLLAESEGGEIFWVETLRIAEPFKVSPRTRYRLRWAWSRKA